MAAAAARVLGAAAWGGRGGGLHPARPGERPCRRALAARSSLTATCRRCGSTFDPENNTGALCRYHTALYTGGERGKAVGFVRQSEAQEHQLAAVLGTGLLRFWDCCGALSATAPGCCSGPHASFDDL